MAALPVTKMDNLISHLMNVVGKLSFFKDINPEVDIITVFETKLKYTESGIMLVDNPLTTNDLIDKLIMDNLEITTRNSKISPKFRSKHAKFRPMIPLAFHKGFKLTCEVCPNRPHLMCKKCKVTYYCCFEHSETDTLHERLCERIKMIRWPISFRGSSYERRRLFSQKLLLKERLLNEIIHMAYKLLSQHLYTNSMACFFQCLQWMAPVYGVDVNSHPQLVSVYTGIAQCQMHLGDYEGAFESIHSAREFGYKLEDWPERPYKLNLILMQINRTRGLLYYEIKEYEEAIHVLAESVLSIAKVFHPTHVRTCLAYFHLARCFIKINRNSDGYSLLRFTIKVLFDSLVAMLKKQLPDTAVYHHIEATRHCHPMMSPYTETEIVEFLNSIREFVSVGDQSMLGTQVLVCETMLAIAQKKYPDVRHLLRTVHNRNIDEVKGSHLIDACRLVQNVMHFNVHGEVEHVKKIGSN